MIIELKNFYVINIVKKFWCSDTQKRPAGHCTRSCQFRLLSSYFRIVTALVQGKKQRLRVLHFWW